jgi:2-polyprenyl-6-methoxyphenol hydroxylase-like FAD-dependent oxidoreductase
VAGLRRWGLLDRIVASGCPASVDWRFDVGPFALRGNPPSADSGGVEYCPRRVVLDDILVRAAVAAGAELRERFTVQEVLTEGGRVTGIRGRTSGGASVTERARVVIGADGMRSFVARSVGAAVYNARPGRTCSYYTYFSGVPLTGVEIYSRPGRAIVALRTNHDLACICTAWPVRDFARVRANLEREYMDSFELAPDLADRVRGGRREERFVGTGELPFFYRKPYGPGWALVGDAGYHKDPNLGQGINDAFRDADLLADALDAGFGGRQPLDEALAEYERVRNEETAEIYDFGYQLAALEPPTRDLELILGALIGNQADTDSFFGLIAGTNRPSAFFAPENVGRILDGAAVPA